MASTSATSLRAPALAAVAAGVLASAAALATGAPPSRLYGLANAYAQSYYFAAILDNATIVDLGFKYLDELPVDALADIDEATQTYYFLESHWNSSITEWQLRHTGVSLNDGSILSSCPVPFPGTEPIGYGQVMAWDSETNQLIAGGAAAPGVNNSYIIGFVDPSTCGWTPITTFDLPDPFVDAGAAAYCPNTHSFMFVGGSVDSANKLYVYSVNVLTGAVTQSEPQNGTDGHNLQTMDYDPSTGKLYGIGLMPADNPQNAIRTIVCLDCVSGEYKVVATVPQYLTQYGTVATLDVAGRGLYWIGSAANASSEAPMYLIKNNIDTGAIISVSDQHICQFERQPNFIPCPWSLQYLNPV